jgi:intracellular septation protein
MNAQFRRLLLDLGPLILFFATYKLLNVFAATAVLMVAVLSSLSIGYVLEKRLTPMSLFTAAMVLIFGGLTLYLRDQSFLKIKVTLLYSFFSIILLGGLAFKRLYIKYIFGDAFNMADSAWKQLTWRWGIFFLTLALLNEAVWRNVSFDTWVYFKVWGIIPLIFLFALAQTPFVMKHHIEPEKTAD